MSTPSDKSLQPRTLDELLNEMQAVCDKASTPPWAAKCSIIDVGDSGYYSATRACGPSHITYGGFSKEVLVSPTEANRRAKFDVEFIAMSREALPRLIHALRFTVKHVYKYAGLTSNEEREFEAIMSKILQGRS